ncbi:dipeptidase PepV [Vallitalea guaymasensis]|uniref:dipeptidase PepV n=1 Tax=Vallitalea guaymasensis TaxID=1185412 RepID=UPI00272D093D|nr:dipeptidase PepV [Vallitalea guaymasensis]
MNFRPIIDGYRDEIIKSIQGLIQIKSVNEEPVRDYPFGEGPYKTLQYALNLGEKLGYKTENVDNYAGHIEMGHGEDIIGILAHLDVVPEGEGWTFPPYEGRIHQNRIYGRGASDDKGPVIAALYAMKVLEASGVDISKRIRLILGTSEETSPEDMRYYLSKKETPSMAFSPDASFPVIKGEMGILEIILIKQWDKDSIEKSSIESIEGGNAANMVPDLCTANLEVDQIAKKKVIEIIDGISIARGISVFTEEITNGIKIISKGISAHGGKPEEGKNAISQMMMVLELLDIGSAQVEEFISIYNEKIGMTYNGQNIGCGFRDDISGELKLNIGVIKLDKNSLEIRLNVRYPITTDSQKVIDNIREELSKGKINVFVKNHLKPIYMDEEHFLVQKLMKAYKKVTGDYEAEPLVISGGTYARAMKNAVAFGINFPGEKETEHLSDEYIDIDNLLKCTEIFAEALYELIND